MDNRTDIIRELAEDFYAVIFREWEPFMLLGQRVNLEDEHEVIVAALLWAEWRLLSGEKPLISDEQPIDPA